MRAVGGSGGRGRWATSTFFCKIPALIEKIGHMYHVFTIGGLDKVHDMLVDR